MKKKTLIILSVVVLIALLYVIFKPKDTFDIDTVVYLEQYVLPKVIETDTKFFLSSDWCNAILYATSTAFDPINEERSKECSDLLGSATSNTFTIEDKSVFNQLKTTLYSRNLSFYRIDSSGSESVDESDDLEFYLVCDKCNIRYVYAPNYSELPKNIRGKVRYHAINADWYKVEEIKPD